jgi:hypothetical protein
MAKIGGGLQRSIFARVIEPCDFSRLSCAVMHPQIVAVIIVTVSERETISLRPNVELAHMTRSCG